MIDLNSRRISFLAVNEEKRIKSQRELIPWHYQESSANIPEIN